MCPPSVPGSSGPDPSAEPARAALDLGPPVDEKIFSSLRDLGGADEPGFLAAIVDLFIEDADDQLRSMRRAVETGDAVAVEACAHSLKSASAYLGALGMAEFCRQLQDAGRAGAMAGAVQVMTRLEREFDLVRQALLDQLDRA